MRPTRQLAASAAVIALALAACGGGDTAATTDGGTDTTTGAAAGGSSITVDASEFMYAPSDLTAAAGTINVTLKNVGDAPHNFNVEDGDAVAVIKDVNTGESGTGTIDLEAGTYTVFCSVAGHREAGMEATLTVS